MPKISRRMMLLGGGATVLVGGAVAYALIPILGATAAQIEMTPPQALAAAKSGDILLVDIRQPWEWEKYGVPVGAHPIDLRRDDFIQAVEAVREHAEQPIALICARGVRSRRLTLKLDAAGVGPIVDVPEGMLGSVAGPGWLKRDLPVTVWQG